MTIPKLRFPEFRGKGEWDSTAGDQLFIPIVNKDHNSDLPILAISQEFGAVPRYLIDYHMSVTEKSVESYKIVDIGDFIISLRSFQGGIEYSDYKGICSPAYIVLRKSHNRIRNNFYRFYFKTDRFIMELNKNLEGIRDGKMVSYSQFSALKLPFPLPEEQQKIADCLSSLDELIAAYNQKLAALKIHKKGLMQQLFPAEGETVPRLRFPEFQDAGEWEEKRLDEVCYRIMDGTHFSPKSQGGTFLYLTSKNIREGRIDLTNSSFISKKEHEEIYFKCPVKKNDLLLTKDGANTGLCALNTLDYEFSILSSVAVIRGNNNLIVQSFLFQSFIADLMQKQINNSISGQAITRITLEKISSYLILLPSLPEQQKIADFLSSLDELIAAQTQKIEVLKTHKKGLMQQLFPAAEELRG